MNMGVAADFLSNLKPDFIDTFLYRGAITLAAIFGLWVSHTIIVFFTKRHLKTRHHLRYSKIISLFSFYFSGIYYCASLV